MLLSRQNAEFIEFAAAIPCIILDDLNAGLACPSYVVNDGSLVNLDFVGISLKRENMSPVIADLGKAGGFRERTSDLNAREPAAGVAANGLKQPDRVTFFNPEGATVICEWEADKTRPG